MKIFYAVQATGNGHISRAMELLPHLEQYGTVDILLSGANSHLALDAPIKYRSNGLSLFYNCHGGLDYWKIVKEMHLLKLRKEIQDLPVEKYDLVINDFDYITAAACTKKKIPSINYGHQASFQSVNTPRPEKKSAGGEWILKNFARATHYVGLHFDRYDDYIFTPVVKKEILEASPTDKKYITVYLPSYCEPQLKDIFNGIPDYQFQVFIKEISQPKKEGNIIFLPIDKKMFTESLIHCTGIITGGGFETPAEAIHLGKKIMSIPIKGQYEQVCNGAALKKLGITCKQTISGNFKNEFYEWLNSAVKIQVDYSNSIEESLNYLFQLHKKSMGEDFPIFTEDFELS
ncbi:MAG: glycosyl transferase [Chitinophagaceae bacterium]|nr:glycosyl transferase [Chitinophagaceae bacterium]